MTYFNWISFEAQLPKNSQQIVNYNPQIAYF